MTSYEIGLQLSKQADILDNYSQLAAQRYMPIGKRREFSPEETSEIGSAESRVLPTLFPSLASPAHSGMYSPLSSAALSGLLGAGIGGLGGAAVSQNNPLAAAIGALGGGTIGGIYGYLKRRQANDSIREMLRRLPEGATMRDLESDPVRQAEKDRAAQLQAAAMTAYALSHR